MNPKPYAQPLRKLNPTFPQASTEAQKREGPTKASVNRKGGHVRRVDPNPLNPQQGFRVLGLGRALTAVALLLLQGSDWALSKDSWLRGFEGGPGQVLPWPTLGFLLMQT